MKKCDCCAISTEKIILENGLALLIAADCPKSEGHSLVLVKRHVADFQETTKDEMTAVVELLDERRKQLLADDASIEKINVRINMPHSSHCNIHIIPRRKNDGLSEIGD